MAGPFKDVSHLTGVTVSTLSKVENDQMSLTHDKLLQICAGLGVHVTELLSGDSKQPSARTRRSATSAMTTLRQRTRNYNITISPPIWSANAWCRCSLMPERARLRSSVR